MDKYNFLKTRVTLIKISAFSVNVIIILYIRQKLFHPDSAYSYNLNSFGNEVLPRNLNVYLIKVLQGCG